jgi:hypothetical protein
LQIKIKNEIVNGKTKTEKQFMELLSACSINSPPSFYC